MRLLLDTNIFVYLVQDRDSLDLHFLRRFDTMFWDSANQRMYLWNDTARAKL